MGPMDCIQCLVIINHTVRKLEIFGHKLLSVVLNVFPEPIPRIGIIESKIMILF